MLVTATPSVGRSNPRVAIIQLMSAYRQFDNPYEPPSKKTISIQSPRRHNKRIGLLAAFGTHLVCFLAIATRYWVDEAQPIYNVVALISGIYLVTPAVIVAFVISLGLARALGGPKKESEWLLLALGWWIVWFLLFLLVLPIAIYHGV